MIEAPAISTPKPAGRWVAAVGAVLCAGGSALWVVQATSQPDGAWRGLLVNYVFFTPLAAGMVVWSAVVILMNGRWAGAAERWTLGGAAFALPSVLLLAALWWGREHWATWADPRHVLPGQEGWFDARFVLARDLAGLVLLWAAAWWYGIRRRTVRPTRIAGCLVVLYAVVMTVLAFDLVMALDPHWFSSLFGGYLLVTGAYAGLAVWVLAAVARGQADAERRHDFGKLLVALGLLSTYFMYSQLLPIWYTNLGHEVRFVLPRLQERPWMLVSAALLAVVYLGPLVLLLTVRAKRSPVFLSAVACLVLAGLWVERWWLIVPTLERMAAGQQAQTQIELGLPELSAAAALGGALLLGLARMRPAVYLDAPVEGGQP